MIHFSLFLSDFNEFQLLYFNCKNEKLYKRTYHIISPFIHTGSLSLYVFIVSSKRFDTFATKNHYILFEMAIQHLYVLLFYSLDIRNQVYFLTSLDSPFQKSKSNKLCMYTHVKCAKVAEVFCWVRWVRRCVAKIRRHHQRHRGIVIIGGDEADILPECLNLR